MNRTSGNLMATFWLEEEEEGEEEIKGLGDCKLLLKCLEEKRRIRIRIGSGTVRLSNPSENC